MEESHQGEKLKHEGWNDISEKKRSCTDFLMLLVLIAVWVAMTAVGLVVMGAAESDQLPAGNPNRLLYPMDHQGRICGVDSGVTSLKAGYYMYDSSVVCVNSCPTASNYTAFICKEDYQAAADASVPIGWSYIAEGHCMYQLKSNSMINRCIPADDVGTSASEAAVVAAAWTPSNDDLSSYTYKSNSNNEWFTSFASDVYGNRGVIFGIGIGVAVAMSFIYLYILKIPGVLSLIIWGLLLSIAVFLLVGTFLLYSLSQEWAKDDVHTNTESQSVLWLSYILGVVTVLYLCLLLVMQSRVNLAIAVVKEANKAMTKMPLIIVMPVFQAFGLVCFMTMFIIYGFYLASSGEEKTHTYTSTAGNEYTYRTFEYADNTKYAFVYMIFCWFWTSQFIIAFGQMSIALAFVAWYFCHDKDSRINSGTVFWAMRTVTWYHLGTVAFGALVIAVVKSIRAVLNYVKRKLKGKGGPVVDAIVCCCQCCMWCLDKCMQFINKNAYIQVAIYGYSFCYAAGSAFQLIIRNALRVAAVNTVADFLLLLGKIFISVSTTLIAYMSIVYGGAQVNGLLSPLIFVFLISYFIASMFTEIFGMGIETILCCYIADEEMFEDPDKRYAEASLRATMSDTQKKGASNQIAPASSSNKSVETDVKPTQVAAAPHDHSDGGEVML
jgi:choline transporter-like protein 2/4/5